jgi:hypothetical protein
VIKQFPRYAKHVTQLVDVPHQQHGTLTIYFACFHPIMKCGINLGEIHLTEKDIHCAKET